MTDERYTDDDRLDTRLREGLGALVAEAPEPPALPDLGSAAGRSPAGRRPLVLAAVVVLLVVAVAAVVVAQRDDGDKHVTLETPSTTLPAGSGLVGTHWMLSDAQEGDEPVTVERSSVELVSRLSFARCTDADCAAPYRISGDEGCDIFVGSLDITGTELRLAEVGFTDVGCRNDQSALLRRALSENIRYQRDGDTLRLTTGTIALEYRRTAAPEGTVVAEDLQDGHAWRLLSRRHGDTIRLESIVYESVARGGGVVTAVGSTDTTDASQVIPADSRQVVYGFAPARATRVTAQVDGREPVELRLFAVEDSDGLLAFAGVTVRGATTIRISDVSGQVIQQEDKPAL